MSEVVEVSVVVVLEVPVAVLLPVEVSVVVVSEVAEVSVDGLVGPVVVCSELESLWAWPEVDVSAGLCVVVLPLPPVEVDWDVPGPLPPLEPSEKSPLATGGEVAPPPASVTAVEPLGSGAVEPPAGGDVVSDDVWLGAVSGVEPELEWVGWDVSVG